MTSQTLRKGTEVKLTDGRVGVIVGVRSFEYTIKIVDSTGNYAGMAHVDRESTRGVQIEKVLS